MDKTAKCIRLLQLLNTGRVYSRKELAELLGTSERNIIEYIEELKKPTGEFDDGPGYMIDSVRGRNGGYRLDRNYIVPSVRFTPSESMAIKREVEYIEAQKDFLDKENFRFAVAKLFSSMNVNDVPGNLTIIPGVTLSMSSEEIRKRYDAADYCKKNNVKLKIRFLSNNNKENEYTIHPYELFIYNDAWFTIGFNEELSEVRYYKLNRIIDFRVTSDKFRRLTSFSMNDYIDKDGLKKGGDWAEKDDSGKNGWIHVKLEFHGRPAMYVKEYMYGRNQKVFAIDQDTTILECDMHYRYNSVRFVLQFGSDCKVIEPVWLKEEVCKQHRLAIEN